MGDVIRAVVTPLSIIDKGIAKAVLQVVAVVAPFIPGGQPIAAAAALTLALLYRPKGPKPEQQERSVRTPIPPRVSAYGRVRLWGAYALFVTSEEGQAVDVWAFHDGLLDAIEQHYLADKPVTITGGFVDADDEGAYGDDVIEVGTRLGLATETAFAEVIAALPGIWTTDHRGDGVATGCMVTRPVKAKNYNEVFPSGGPDQTPLSLLVRAQRVFNWRDPAQDVLDDSTWTWSENVALQLVHYYLVRAGKDWDTHFAPTLDYWTAFADDCDVAMPLKAGGTEPRYRGALAHKHTDPHKVTIGNLLACCDGFVAPRSDGALVAYSGRYYEPTVSIGPSEIVGYTWDDGIVDEDAVNEIALTYISAEHDYAVVDAPAWRDLDAISLAGEVKSVPLENSVPSQAQARRLAKRLMSKTSSRFRGSVTTNRAGRVVRGERYIDLHIEEAGTVFFSGPAEITTLSRNLSTGGVTFEWIAADPDIDDWDPAEEEGDVSAPGTLPGTTPLDAPTIASAIAEFAGSNATLTITVNSPLPAREDLTWFARWRVVGTTNWGGELEFSDLPAGATVELVTDLVPMSGSVEVEASYSVGDGRHSPWSDPAEVITGSITADMDTVTADTTYITADRG